MNIFYFILLLLFSISFITNSYAIHRCDKKPTLDCTYNPNPEETDFSLPMPGNLEIVFKKVVVPGEEFWGNSERLVKIGDIQGSSDNAIFESIQRLPIFGAFYDWELKHWYYYLGKYEITLNQFIMVLGEGKREKGLAYLYQESADKKLIKQLKSLEQSKQDEKLLHLLSFPLSSISWFSYQKFIHSYNKWCFNNLNCYSQLPRLPKRLGKEHYESDELPGFFRLPTELEWEYAVRGGMNALKTVEGKQPAYEETLPFSKSQMKKYAQVKPHSHGETTNIGRLKAVNGFYDVFGNVQELTAYLFKAEMIQGKVGALTVRGGSYTTDGRVLRTSLRNELGIYQLDNDKKIVELRSPTSGIRLSIGSLVVQSERFRDDIKNYYSTYQQSSYRQQTPVAKSNSDQLVQGTNDLQKIEDTINTLKTDNQILQTQMETIRKVLFEANQKFEDGTKSVCRELAKNAFLTLKTAGFHYSRLTSYQKHIKKLKTLTISGKTQKIFDMQERISEAEKGFNEHFNNYTDNLQKLGGYPEKYVQPVIAKIRESSQSDNPIAKAAIELLDSHLSLSLTGIVNIQKWREDVEKMALSHGIYKSK